MRQCNPRANGMPRIQPRKTHIARLFRANVAGNIKQKQAKRAAAIAVQGLRKQATMQHSVPVAKQELFLFIALASAALRGVTTCNDGEACARSLPDEDALMKEMRCEEPDLHSNASAAAHVR